MEVTSKFDSGTCAPLCAATKTNRPSTAGNQDALAEDVLEVLTVAIDDQLRAQAQLWRR